MAHYLQWWRLGMYNEQEDKEEKSTPPHSLNELDLLY